jgi:hypothetical protein
MSTGFQHSQRGTGQRTARAVSALIPAAGSSGGAAGRDRPPLLLPAVAFAVFTIAATAASAGVPQVSAAPAVIATYVARHTGLLEVQATLLYASAVPLAIWAAAAYRRLRQLGVAAPGPLIGYTGGLLAVASLSASALTTWTLAHAGRDPAAADALRTLAFATGAAGFVVPLGLLLAGMAVPTLLRGLAPGSLGWAGLVIAITGLLATLTLLTPALDPLLPIGRFGGLLWIIAASLTLHRPAGPPLERGAQAP